MSGPPADGPVRKILVVQPLVAEALRLFAERPDVVYEVAEDASPAALLPKVGDADAMTLRDAPMPVDVLEAAPRLRVIARHGVGTDNVPLDYCTARGLPVAVAGPVNAVSVAEHALFLMLAVARRAVERDHATRIGAFAAARASDRAGVELRGRRLLVVGYGRIGREVAARAAAFGMVVRAFDPPAAGVSLAAGAAPVAFVPTLEEGLRWAQVVSLHVPLSSGTRGLIGAPELALLPEDAILVNTARGGIVDEDALLEAVVRGRLMGAGLDTFAQEPLPAGHPIAAERRIVLSPHAAALTKEALLAMGLSTAQNALDGLDGRLDPDLVVNASVLR